VCGILDAMEPMVTALVAQLARPFINAVAEGGFHIAFGAPERRELRRVISRAAARAVELFPEIAAISADIDLLGNEAVAKELLAATIPNAMPQWQAAQRRWQELYGAPGNASLAEFLDALAAELRPLLQGSPLLQGLWIALTVEVSAVQLGHHGDLMGQLIDRVDGLANPLSAIQSKRGEISSDLGYAISVANALADALANGIPGKGIELRLKGQDGSVQIVGAPGTEVSIEVTKIAPPTKQGRRELAKIDAALKAGKAIDVGEVNIAMRVAGQPVTLPSPTARLKVGRATRKLTILVDLVTPGVDELRLLFEGDSYMEAGTIHFDAAKCNHGPIGIQLSVDLKTRKTKARFFVSDDAEFLLKHQVVFQRVLRFMGLGGHLIVDFVDPPITRGSTEVSPNPNLGDAAHAVEPLTRLEELASLLTLKLPAVRSISGKDHALIVWAIELVRKGEVAVASSGSLQLKGTREMADDLARGADENGRLSLRYDLDEYALAISSGIKIELGPLQHRISGATLANVREVAEDEYEAQITYGADDAQQMVRLPSPARGADSPEVRPTN
jgi:hypothetical protein